MNARSYKDFVPNRFRFPLGDLTPPLPAPGTIIIGSEGTFVVGDDGRHYPRRQRR